MSNIDKISKLNIKRIVIIKSLPEGGSEVFYIDGTSEVSNYASNKIIDLMCVIHSNSTMDGKRIGTMIKTSIKSKIPVEILGDIVAVPVGGIQKNTDWIFTPPMYIEEGKYNSVKLYYPQCETPIELDVSKRVLDSALARRNRFFEISEYFEETEFNEK